MKIDIEKIIRVPFEEEDWIRRSGVIIAGVLALMITSIGSYTIVYIGWFVSFMSTVSNESLIPTVLVSIVVLVLYGLIILLIMTGGIYLRGYQLDIMKNTMNNVKPVLPLHTNFLARLKYGLKGSVPTFLLMIINITIYFTLFFGATFISIRFANTELAQTTNIVTIVVFFLFAMTGIFTIAMIVIMWLAIPAMDYLYITTDSIKQALNPTAIISVIKISWKNYLLVLGIILLISFIGMFAVMISSCLSFITYPVFIAILFIIQAHLYGLAFRDTKQVIGNIYNE